MGGIWEILAGGGEWVLSPPGGGGVKRFYHQGGERGGGIFFFSIFSPKTTIFLIIFLKIAIFLAACGGRGGIVVNKFLGRGGSTFLDVRGGYSPPIPPPCPRMLDIL